MSSGVAVERRSNSVWVLALAAVGVLAALGHFVVRVADVLRPTSGLVQIGDGPPLAFNFDWDLLHWITKPIPVIALIALTFALSPASEPRRKWIVIGLICSLAGDIFLMLPGNYFIHGLVSFLVGHLFYVRAFIVGRPPLAPLRIVPFLIFGGAVAAWLWPGLGEMRIPVVIYMLVILTMGWRAAARVGFGAEPSKAHWAGALGAVSFILSDSMIAIDKFHEPSVIPLAGLWIMVTYWVGQLGIARSVWK